MSHHYRRLAHLFLDRRARIVTLVVGTAFAWACQGTQVTYAPSDASSERVATMLEGYREARAQKELMVDQEMKRKQAATPSAVDLIAQGDKQRDSGELAEALFTYLQAYNSNASDPSSIERVAHLHLRKEPRRAATIFEQLIAGRPEDASLHVGLGLARLSQDQLERAEESLVRAISLDPESATPRCILGVFHDRMGDHGAARESYRVAHHLRPDDYSILNNLAISYILDAMPEHAVPHLERAIVLEPRDRALQNNLGLALALSRDDEAALQAFKAVGSEPEAYNNLGYARYLRGDYEEAIEAYERALGVRGDAVLRVIRNLELAHEALGKQRETPESGAL